MAKEEKKKEEKKEEGSEEEEDEELHKPITRQIQVQKLHFNVLMSTEDPNETIDYLVYMAKELLDEYTKD